MYVTNNRFGNGWLALSNRVLLIHIIGGITDGYGDLRTFD